MTPHELDIIAALQRVTFPVGCPDKRFASDMGRIASPEREITIYQSNYLERLAWKYRRQMPAELVPSQKPVKLEKPPKPKTERRPKRQETPADPKQMSLID
jgi:hypothetical protein